MKQPTMQEEVAEESSSAGAGSSSCSTNQSKGRIDCEETDDIQEQEQSCSSNHDQPHSDNIDERESTAQVAQGYHPADGDTSDDHVQQRRLLTDIPSTPDSALEAMLHHLQIFRYQCGMIVNNSTVQLFILSLIAINALMMGIATFDFVMENERVDVIFEKVDRAFLIVFSVELAMQFVYHGWRLFADGWLLFDLVIIATSWAFANAQIIRAFRAIRAMRLITRVKVMQNLVIGK